MNYSVDDDTIINHYFERLECAISETKNKYGTHIFNIAYNILHDKEYSEECENDTYLKLWNSIPPNKPHNFIAYCLKISRNNALKKYEYLHAGKRNIEKNISLTSIMDDYNNLFLINPNDNFSNEDLAYYINAFLETLSSKKRKIFMLRYWYFLSTKEISTECNLSKNQVEVTLFRLRKQLKDYLLKRGISV